VTADRHDDLVLALRALGDHLAVAADPVSADPVSADPADGLRPDPATAAVRRIVADRAADPIPRPARREPARLARRGARRPLVLVAAALVVALAVAVAVPGSRAALARLLGIGGVAIVRVDEAPDAPAAPYDLGAEIDVADLAARAPAPVVPDGLGPPDAAFAGEPAGAVSAVWRPAPDLPPVGDDPAGPGLIVTAIPGPVDAPVMTKEVGPGSDVRSTTVGGNAAYWISGAPHAVGIVAGTGGAGGEEVRLAGNTLLWTDAGVTYRLESDLALDAAVALAERLPQPHPPGEPRPPA
jgi:hypothetical protein